MLKRAKKWSLEDDRTYTKECDYCDGDGDVTGDDGVVIPCPICGGRGRVPTEDDDVVREDE